MMKADDLTNKEADQGSKLLFCTVDTTADYYNRVAIGMSFSRWNKDCFFLELRDIISFDKGEDTALIIAKLRGLANRLEKNCINRVKHAHRCPNYGVTFFNFSKRKKKYCSARCQNHSAVKRYRIKEVLLKKG